MFDLNVTITIISILCIIFSLYVCFQLVRDWANTQNDPVNCDIVAYFSVGEVILLQLFSWALPTVVILGLLGLFDVTVGVTDYGRPWGVDWKLFTTAFTCFAFGFGIARYYAERDNPGIDQYPAILFIFVLMKMIIAPLFALFIVLLFAAGGKVKEKDYSGAVVMAGAAAMLGQLLYGLINADKAKTLRILHDKPNFKVTF